MNKRQRIKRDGKLKKAIRELNDDVSKDLEQPYITDEQVEKTFNRIVKNPDAINQTFKHHRKFILNN